MGSISAGIGSLDLIFENSPVKVIANRNCPEIKLIELNVGPFEKDGEYEIQYWVADELRKLGAIRFHEDEALDVTKISKIQWIERIQTVGQISRLPDDFYPKVRRFMMWLREEAAKQPEKMQEYEKVRHLTHDIVNLRLKKIISLAAAPAQTERFLKNLVDEEKFLYKKLHRIINEWRDRILGYGGENER